MKKIKRIWQENSVLFVLFGILFVCIAAITLVFFTYFVGDRKSKYGERLDGIEKYVFNENDQTTLENKIKENEEVISVDVRLSGKIIYINMKFDTSVKLEEAYGISLESLKNISDELLNFYDVQFLIQRDDTEKSEGFKLMGSHNVSGTGGIVWNNNRKVETETETEEK